MEVYKGASSRQGGTGDKEERGWRRDRGCEVGDEISKKEGGGEKTLYRDQQFKDMLLITLLKLCTPHVLAVELGI